jgi:Ribbon-helix-helix protein, copG family
MKRTTVYLEAELDARLKREARRQGRPVAELIREAAWQMVRQTRVRQPPGAGAFASKRATTADDVDAALEESGFGRRR